MSAIPSVSIPVLAVPKHIRDNARLYDIVRNNDDNGLNHFHAVVNIHRGQQTLWQDCDRNYYYDKNKDTVFILDKYTALNSEQRIGLDFYQANVEHHTFWAILCPKDDENTASYSRSQWAYEYVKAHRAQHNFCFLSPIDDIWWESPDAMPTRHLRNDETNSTGALESVIYLLLPQSLFSETDLVAMRLRGEL